MTMDDPDRTASPWPILVALGIAVGELGVLFGFVSLAVGGILAFGLGAASILREADVVRGRARPVLGVGILIGALGLLVWSLRVYHPTLDAYLAMAATDGIAARAAIVVGAAVLLVAGGLLGIALETRRRQSRPAD